MAAPAFLPPPLGNVPRVGRETEHPSGNYLPWLWTGSKKSTKQQGLLQSQFNTRPIVHSYYTG